MEFFVETMLMTKEDFYSGRIGSQLLEGETIPLEFFDFNNVPSNIICFRSYYLRNEKPVYTGWVYNGKKISLDELRQILADTKTLREEASAEIYTKKMQYSTDIIPADNEIAFLCTTFGRLGYLIGHIEDTIKYMETYRLQHVCGINFSAFYPMFEDDLTLAEYLEAMKGKGIASDLNCIIDNQVAMNAAVLKLITYFKSQNQEYFKIDNNGDWDFTWLDNATPEDAYNLFMLCVELMKGLNSELGGQREIWQQMEETLKYVSPKEFYRRKRLAYKNSDITK